MERHRGSQTGWQRDTMREIERHRQTDMRENYINRGRERSRQTHWDTKR